MWMVSSKQGLCVDPGMYVDGVFRTRFVCRSRDVCGWCVQNKVCVDPGVYVDGEFKTRFVCRSRGVYGW